MNIHEARARQLLGTLFRPQGRDRTLGLDCVGVAQSVYDLPAVPSDYRLRGDHLERARDFLARHFTEQSGAGSRVPGDLLLLKVASDQIHFAVQCSASFIHADAGLLRTVEVPGEPSWPIIGVFRPRKD